MIVDSPLYCIFRTMCTVIVSYDYDVFSRTWHSVSPQRDFFDHIVQKFYHVHLVRSINYVIIKVHLIFMATYCAYYCSTLSSRILIV